MRANSLVAAGSVIVLLLAWAPETRGQPPGTGQRPQGPADDESQILKEIREAYKAPFEVHEDILKELRRSYGQPTPDRENKIFRELRRLYVPTPEQEASILREIRRAYENPSAQQEERIFREIGRADRLPAGAVPPSVQADQAEKMFRRLDQNGDGRLSPEEMPESLRAERGRWDANRDGFIDLKEYWAYYQSRLSSLSERVASGEIDLKLGNRGPAVNIRPAGGGESRSEAGKSPSGLPDWFLRLDTDRDGQVALHEWRRSGRPDKEFFSIDANDDGFITAEEMLRFLAGQAANGPNGPTRNGTATASKPSKR